MVRTFSITIMENWMIFILITAGAYLAFCLLAYLMQDLFLFHPEKLKHNFQFEYDHPFEEVIIPGIEENVINGLHFKVENAKGVVFYFKGNTRSIKGWAKFAKDFTSKGYHFFMIDYPGFGKSTGKRSEQRIYMNAQIAYEWLLKTYDEKDIVIYGRSLGAGFAVGIAANNNPRMFILDSPYYSFTELAKYYTRILPLNWLLKYRMPLYKYMQKVNCPTFILHGRKDRIIPYRFSPRIEAIAPDRIKLFTIEGAGHNNLPKHKEYHTKLAEILSKQ
jgi:fermentation-respiration switch protein FrsA (DUF1100 family)